MYIYIGKNRKINKKSDFCIIWELGGSSRVQNTPTGSGNHFHTRDYYIIIWIIILLYWGLYGLLYYIILCQDGLAMAKESCDGNAMDGSLAQWRWQCHGREPRAWTGASHSDDNGVVQRCCTNRSYIYMYPDVPYNPRFSI